MYWLSDNTNTDEDLRPLSVWWYVLSSDEARCIWRCGWYYNDDASKWREVTDAASFLQSLRPLRKSSHVSTLWNVMILLKISEVIFTMLCPGELTITSFEPFTWTRWTHCTFLPHNLHQLNNQVVNQTTMTMNPPSSSCKYIK